ncbi:MAG: restriction endonuclease subunit S [Ruminococcus sp.]|nr:restriction endonuclease subunit S [Ruminococcus sp.]
MKEKWKKYKVSELCTDIIDCVNKTAPVSEIPTDFQMLRTSDIRNGFINLEKLNCVTEATFLKWSRRGFLKEGDIIFTREAPLGEVGLVRSAENYFLGQRLVLYRADPEICDNRFLLYWFLNPQNKEIIKSKGLGTTVTHLRVQDCKAIEIDVPDLATQKKISSILSALDDKIELNNKINKNLFEQIAVLYKNLTNESDNYKNLNLSELCNFQEGYVNPAQPHPEYFNGKIKWLRAVDINESFIIDTSRTLTESGFKSAKKSAVMFRPNTIVISKSGTIGRLGIIADYMCGNRAVINIQPKQDQFLPFIYSFLKSKKNELDNLAVGSVQKNLYISKLENLTVSCPTENLLTNFCNISNFLLLKIHNNCFENQRLSDLRDALLPELFSGGIDLSRIK